MALSPAPRDERPSVGFGLLGCGFMGKAHSHALLAAPHIFSGSPARPQLVAIAARSEERARQAATRYGYSYYTADWRELVAAPQVQVFDNVAADAAHVEPTLAAIEAGKHVVCEKPLASNATDAMRMYKAAAARGVKNMVGFNYRFFPAVRLAWEMARQGDLGELYQARFRYSQEWRTSPSAPLPSPTGVIDIVASHAFDQARFLCGEVAAVQAFIGHPVTTAGRTFEGAPVQTDDTVTVLAELVTGPAVTIDASLVSPGRRNHLAWELNCSRASVAWDLEHPNVLRVLRPSRGAQAGATEILACEAEHPLAGPWWPSGHVLGWEHGHANMLAHFVEAVATGSEVAPFGATFLDGLRAAQMAEAVRRAAEGGGRVEVAPAPAADEPGAGGLHRAGDARGG